MGGKIDPIERRSKMKTHFKYSLKFSALALRTPSFVKVTVFKVIAAFAKLMMQIIQRKVSEFTTFISKENSIGK